MSRKQRVLYVYPYLQFDTGSPKAMVQILDVLDRELFEPVFCANGEGPLTKALAERGVEIVNWPIGTACLAQPLGSVREIARQASLLREHRIDLIHANCFPWNTDILLAARLIGIPVILHVHNRMDIPFRNLTRFAARKVIFCSESVMRHSGGVERVGRKAMVLHNMIDVQQWRQPAIRRELALDPGDIAIGLVAQIVYLKGIDIFLDAARSLLRERNDLVFLIAGPQNEAEKDFAERMFAASRDPSLRGRVRFLGSRSDIPNFMASLDLFVLPTRHEAFGIVVIEAMAAGVPVIASKIGGLPEIINSPEIGRLVDPLTPTAFASAIRDVLSLPDRGRSMAENARESVIRFDVRAGRERVRRLYLELLNADEGLKTAGVAREATQQREGNHHLWNDR